MPKPESFSDLHRLGGFVNEQHDGQKDQPVTGGDLYNVAVQLDSNFASLRADIGNLRTDTNAEIGSLRSDMNSEIGSLRSDMNAEFKAIRSEMTSEFKSVRSEMTSEFRAVRSEMTSEFKAVRAEMKEGFAMVNLRFAELGKDISRTNWKAAGSVIVALIALLGIDRFWQ